MIRSAVNVVLRLQRKRLTLSHAAHVDGLPDVQRIADRASALALLRPFLNEIQNVHLARAFVLQHLGHWDVHKHSATALLDRLVTALVSGQCVAQLIELRSIPVVDRGAIESEVETVSIPDTTPKTWIEVELVDEEGKPVPRERYWIETPDGTVYEGRLSAEGRAYVGGLDPGQCTVRFPDLDDGAWTDATQGRTGSEKSAKFTGSSPTNDPSVDPAHRAWIEVVLLDEADQPVPNERYWIKLPDGRIEQGVLDRRGRVYLDGIPEGTCIVKFPDLDQEAAVEASAGAPEVDKIDAATQAAALTSAAETGVPFCEECEKARKALEERRKQQAAQANA